MKNYKNTRRNIKNILFNFIIYFSISFCLFIFIWMVFNIFKDGLPWISWNFIFNFPSRYPNKTGILPGIIGSFILFILTALMVIKIGICASLYIEEYMNKKSKLYKLIDVCIYNLSGIPSIIYGILGLSIFSIIKPLKATIFSGAVVLSLMILPVIIISSREAFKAVPKEIKEAGYSLGLSKIQVVKNIVFPAALPSCLTGIIIALSRAIGESAPLIVVGAVTIVTTLPTSLNSSFTALPILVYYWSGLPNQEFQNVSAAGSIILIFILAIMNGIAIFLRNKFQFKR